MGLLDHFHPPLSTRRHWHAFPNAWATYIASDSNHQLPDAIAKCKLTSFQQSSVLN